MKVFISQNTSTETVNGQEVQVKAVAFANSVNINRGMQVPAMPSNTPTGERVKIVNINFSLKYLPVEKVEALKKEELAVPTPDDLKMFSENLQVDLNKTPAASLDAKLKTAGEQQDALEDYYFEQGLKSSAFGMIGWDEKK